MEMVYRKFYIVLIVFNSILFFAIFFVDKSKMIYYFIYTTNVGAVGVVVENCLIKMKSQFKKEDRILYDRRRRTTLAGGALLGGIVGLIVGQFGIYEMLIIELIGQILWGVGYYIGSSVVNRIKSAVPVSQI